MIPQALLALMTRDAARSGPVMAIPCLAKGRVLCPHTGVCSHSHRGTAPSAPSLPQAGTPGDPRAFGKGLEDLQVKGVLLMAIQVFVLALLSPSSVLGQGEFSLHEVGSEVLTKLSCECKSELGPAACYGKEKGSTLTLEQQSWLFHCLGAQFSVRMLYCIPYRRGGQAPEHQHQHCLL